MRVRNSLLLGLVAGTTVLAMSACGSQDPAVAGATTASSAAAPSAPSAAAATPSTTPSTTPSAAAGSSAAAPAANGCPVGESTLQKAAGLDAGYKIDSSSIKCKQNWATAGVIAPSAAQQGDGLLVFEFSATTGKWAKKGEASDLTCGGDLGIPASTGLCRQAA